MRIDWGGAISELHLASPGQLLRGLSRGLIWVPRPPGPASRRGLPCPFVEASTSALLHDQLGAVGWVADEPWALLCRDLSTPVEDPGVRVEIIGADRAQLWCEVHRSAFGGSLELAEMTRRWTAKTTGLPFADARALTAFDDHDAAVAVAIVWSAGPEWSGVLEPMGTHADHRGQGYGRAVTLAAARTLQEMGSCAAIVPTLVSNVGAIATYTAAGFEHLGERTDRRRDA